MRKKRKGKGRVGNDTYNTMYKIELIVKEIKHTKSNKKFSDSICQEERLRRFLKNLVAKIYQIKNLQLIKSADLAQFEFQMIKNMLLKNCFTIKE